MDDGATGRAHGADSVFRRQEGSVEIRTQYAAPLGKSGIGEWSSRRDSDAVREDVEAELLRIRNAEAGVFG